MKANFNITIPAVSTTIQGQTVEVTHGGQIGIELDYSLAEMKGLYDLQKQAIEELPALIRAFAIEVCKEAVVAKQGCLEELMKDEDFRKMREESKRQEEEANARFNKLKEVIKKSFSSDECANTDAH